MIWREKTTVIWLFSLCMGPFLWAQITLRVTAIPSNTPANATLYVAGSFNNWNPADPTAVLAPDGQGNYTYTVPQGSGTLSYKFTRGSWATVEGNANGGYLPNRSASFTTQAQTLNLSILSWEDLGGSSNPSTAASNVQILNTAFVLSPLNKTRRIWLYLPPDYYSSNKYYPVLYLHDGQNVFDNATSFAGEWQVDETLNTLAAQGDYGAIVVAIDNGGADRLNEYSPWVNPQYGGGQGDAYIQSIIQSVKPYIDSHYRTRTTPLYTGIAGSSMGGLISAYAAEAYPDTFGRIGILSPAFWFAQSDLLTAIQQSPNNLQALRMYVVASQNESSTIVSECNQVVQAFLSKGVPNGEVRTKYDTYGSHSESYWKGEFGAAYQFLFPTALMHTSESTFLPQRIVPLTNGKIWAEIPECTIAVVYDLTGRQCATFDLQPGYNQPPPLPNGLLMLRIAGQSLKWLHHEE